MTEGAGQAIVLTRHDDLRDAYRSKDLRQGGYDEGAVVTAGTLLDLHGEEHRDRRRLENRLFRRETFRHYERDVLPPRIAEVVQPAITEGRGDLVSIGRRTVVNLTAEIAGLDRVDGTPEETDVLHRLAVKFSEGATLVHSVRDKDEVRTEVREALRLMDERFLQPSIERRRQLLDRFAAGVVTESELPVDVLTTLLRNEEKLSLPADVVQREVALYLQAGSHSTSNAFAHTMHLLFNWFEEHPGGRERVLGDRRFAQRCFHEALRLHPASPVATRRALAPVTLRSGRQIPQGAMVVLDLTAANQDQSKWGSTASRFDPDRSVPADMVPWGNSFGGGVHACIGMELDGGIEPGDSDDPASEHLMGTVALLIEAVMAGGVSPDPDHPPVRDMSTTRVNWSHYPVLFTPPRTGSPS